MKDLIDREAALNCFHAWVDKYGDVYTPDDTPEYQAIEALPSVEAIPVEWINSKIARLIEMDNAFASLTASQIRALLNDWRAEQNE